MRPSLCVTAAALMGMAACDRPADVSDGFFQERERAVFSAFEQRAASEIEKLYGEDFVAINADGSITDKRQAVEAARTNALGLDEIKSDEFRVRRYTDTALVTGRSTYLKAGREVAQVRREDSCRYQPRLHDFRHSFAVTCLIRWYRNGEDVQRLLPQLATYLGHVHIAGTQRYLSMTPELLREASSRFERYAMGGDDHA